MLVNAPCQPTILCYNSFVVQRQCGPPGLIITPRKQKHFVFSFSQVFGYKIAVIFSK